MNALVESAKLLARCMHSRPGQVDNLVIETIPVQIGGRGSTRKFRTVVDKPEIRHHLSAQCHLNRRHPLMNLGIADVYRAEDNSELTTASL